MLAQFIFAVTTLIACSARLSQKPPMFDNEFIRHVILNQAINLAVTSFMCEGVFLLYPVEETYIIEAETYCNRPQWIKRLLPPLRATGEQRPEMSRRGASAANLALRYRPHWSSYLQIEFGVGAVIVLATQDGPIDTCQRVNILFILFLAVGVPYWALDTLLELEKIQSRGDHKIIGSRLCLFLILYQGCQVWSFSTMLSLRTGLKTAVGAKYDDDDWGYGQVLAIFVWLPTLLDLIRWYWLRVVIKGRGAFDAAWSMDGARLANMIIPRLLEILGRR